MTKKSTTAAFPRNRAYYDFSKLAQTPVAFRSKSPVRMNLQW